MDGKRRMTSVKPGRGPSFMGGVTSVVAALFGILWFIAASSLVSSDSMGPGAGFHNVFPLFGLLFTLLAVANAVYHFKNATSENRHSLLEITDGYDEPDPLDPRLRRQLGDSTQDSAYASKSAEICDAAPAAGQDVAPGVDVDEAGGAPGKDGQHDSKQEYWRGKAFAFFTNKACEFFPCHTGIDPDEFNCLFCYCPLYSLGDKCGGRFTYINDIKDCSNCVVPHRRDNYGYITGRFTEIVEAMRRIKQAAQ